MRITIDLELEELVDLLEQLMGEEIPVEEEELEEHMEENPNDEITKEFERLINEVLNNTDAYENLDKALESFDILKRKGR